MSEKLPVGDRALLVLMGFAFTGGGYRALQQGGWITPLAMLALVGGLTALVAAAFAGWGSPTAPALPALSPADEVAAARADSAAQIDAVRAEIAERDAQRRREMDARIAQLREMSQRAPAADGWE